MNFVLIMVYVVKVLGWLFVVVLLVLLDRDVKLRLMFVILICVIMVWYVKRLVLVMFVYV